MYQTLDEGTKEFMGQLKTKTVNAVIQVLREEMKTVSLEFSEDPSAKLLRELTARYNDLEYLCVVWYDKLCQDRKT